MKKLQVTETPTTTKETPGICPPQQHHLCSRRGSWAPLHPLHQFVQSRTPLQMAATHINTSSPRSFAAEPLQEFWHASKWPLIRVVRYYGNTHTHASGRHVWEGFPRWLTPQTLSRGKIKGALPNSLQNASNARFLFPPSPCFLGLSQSSFMQWTVQGKGD